MDQGQQVGSTVPSLTRKAVPRRTPAAFKYLVGAAALFIAGCSAYFSVTGLGMLFIGSATTVMVMAASLEIGKLVAASFLYRYWSQLTIALRFYLIVAVLVLIGITSLGNYGYLARAYEQTKTHIGLLEAQTASLQQEIDDTQKRIDGAKADVGKGTDFGRQDADKVRQAIAQANQSLDGSLARLEDRRKAAKDKRELDVATLKDRQNELAGVLKEGLASEESNIGNLHDRLAELDRAVDAYSQQGGRGLFKDDGVTKGQVLRAQQQAERDSIAGQLEQSRKKQEQLRADHAKTVADISVQIAGVEDQYKKDLTALDGEEKTLRQQNTAAIADANKQLVATASKSNADASVGGSQIEAMYQQIHTDQDQITRVKEQIAATDIGSYRFVARAFNAPADDVVKWLMLIMVLVFDPLAVTLTVGFNVATVRDRQVNAAAEDMTPVEEVTQAARSSWLLRFASASLVLVVLLAILGGGGYFAQQYLHQRERNSHAAMIPADSFLVVTIHPVAMKQSATGVKLPDAINKAGRYPLVKALSAMVGNGFDPATAIYGFVKYPQQTPAGGEKPVMICGVVAKITDSHLAEAGLSRFADQLSESLGQPGALGGAERSREMVRFGKGRYLDPQGGFFSFALTEHEAIILVEIEGDPAHPTVENEMRQCLMPAGDSGSANTAIAYGDGPAKLPARALSSDAPVAVWFDANRCFAQMPKNAIAQARYEQLQKFLAFDVVLTAKSEAAGELDLAGDYAYQGERFQPGVNGSVADVLAKLGSGDQAGIAGRLMDRCVTTLDFDGLIDQLKTSLGTGKDGLGADVLVEKTIPTSRDGKFVLSAHYTAQLSVPVASALDETTH